MHHLAVAASLAFLFVPLVAQDKPVESPVGKPAPAFTVAKWAKGEPVTTLEKGKVYVVDFWATWCGPCKAAIPHLTKLQKDHAGSVVVVGVAVSERQKSPEDDAYVAAVQKFVDDQGERMDYRVAIDTPDKRMHTAWMVPAATRALPTAYVIDRNGLVAWVGIGSPPVVERIVGEVLAGTFDPKQEAARVAKEEAAAKERAAVDIAKARAAQKGTDEKFPGYREAMERGDRSAALEALHAAFQADPARERTAYQWKFMLLLQGRDDAAVDAYGKDLLQRFGDDDDIVSYASAVLVHTDASPPRFDSKLAHALAVKSLAAAKPDSRWQQFARWRLGWSLWHVGDKDAAKKAMLLAKDAVAKLKTSIDFGDLGQHIDDALREFAKPAPAGGAGK